MGDHHLAQALVALLRARQAAVIWRKHEVRPSPGRPNQAAIGRAIASTCGAVDARRYKDRVSDALGGRGASVETIDLICETFGWAADTRDRLIELRGLDGVEADAAVAEFAGPPTDADRPWWTVSLHEFHELGPDGLPARHETVQTVKSAADNLRRIDYRYVHDSGVRSVEVTAGGRVIDAVTGADSIVCTTIELDAPIDFGDTAGVTYVTRFAYPRPPEPAFRRGLRAEIKSLEIKVTFDLARLPAHVYETDWETHDGAPSRRFARHLDRSGTVELFRDRPGAGFVGFSWDWPD